MQSTVQSEHTHTHTHKKEKETIEVKKFPQAHVRFHYDSWSAFACYYYLYFSKKKEKRGI